MKHFSLRVLLLFVCISTPLSLFALRPMQRGNIITLINDIKADNVAPENIWQRIQDIGVASNDYADPKFKELLSIAINKLNSESFTIDGQPIRGGTNLAASKEPEAPGPRYERVTEEGTTIVGPGKSKPLSYERVTEEGTTIVGPGKSKPLTYERVTPGGTKTIVTEEKEEEGPTKVADVTPATVPSQELTLTNALVDLKAIEDDAPNAPTLGIIRALYKDFYKVQDKYFGLSGVPVTTGRLWWKKVVDPSEKTKFAQAAAKTLKAIMDKELELMGEATIKLTPEESKKFVEEINKSNPVEALKNKVITKDQYKQILEVRGELLRWNKRRMSNSLSASDVPAIQTAIAKARSTGAYLGDFSRKMANDLEAYVSSPISLAQTKQLGAVTDQLQKIKDNINDLNKATNEAIKQLSQNGTVVTGFKFKTGFAKIDNAIKALSKGPDQEQVQKLANDAFALFGKYIGMTESQKSSFYTALRQRWFNYWNKPNPETAVAIDKAQEAINRMIDDYKAFPSYIAANETDAKALLNEQLADATQFRNILTRTPQGQRLQVVETVLIELRDKIFMLQRDLAKKDIHALENFKRYQNFMSVIDSSSLLSAQDNEKVQAAWNQLQQLYTEHLSEVLIQYRQQNDLPHLHQLATGETIKVAEDVKNIIPEKPFNAIGLMLEDLTNYLNKNIIARDGINRQIVENLCYMLAAFDGFGYVLLSGTMEANKLTGWYSWFWGLFGYQITANSEKDFRAKNEALVNSYLETIANAITLYENVILSKVSTDQNVQKYNNQNLDILDFLGSAKAKIANLYASDGKTYRYNLVVLSPIKLAGGVEVNAVVPNINAVHKKIITYVDIINMYKQVIATAYKDAKWQQAIKADQMFQQMQKLAAQHDKAMQPVRTQVKELENGVQSATTLQRITELNKQLEDKLKQWNDTVKALQAQYISDLTAQGVTSLQNQ